jgi:hypothetical protein
MAHEAVVGQAGSPFEWRAMEGLACGCVVVAYEARGLGLLFVNVEAKGPLCATTAHEIGRTLTVGDASDLDPDGVPDESRGGPDAPIAIVPV